jgi:tRNA modification GTPase
MGFSVNDTVVAIATPPGRGGIGVVRLSGPAAYPIARQIVTDAGPLEPRHATLARVRSEADGTIDDAIVVYFPAPHSYTGDDVVELSAHGSPVVLRAIVQTAIAKGARLAEPGEFTLRAFLNQKIDLTQAEAVADLIDAATPLQARAAFDQLHGTLTRAIGEIDAVLFDLIAKLEASVDFPDEGYHFLEPGALTEAIDRLRECTGGLLAGARRGRLIREGLQVAIVGRPNVGKSSVFNALAGAARAIVTDVPGTTRDLVTEVVDLDGLRVTLVDTAGLRESRDIVETEGVARAEQARAAADLVLHVHDRSAPLAPGELAGYAPQRKELCVANKSDLPAAWHAEHAIAISAKTGAGLEALRGAIAGALDAEPLRDRPEITNVRHIALVERAHAALGRARRAAAGEAESASEEFVLADLQDARAALEEVTGRRAPEDVLAHIFERFCVGK